MDIRLIILKHLTEHIQAICYGNFDNNSRNSVIAGSVDHDTWKTGTSTWATADNGNINIFGAFAGINSKEFTYDFQPHGSIKGTKVSSPKMF